ncbi:uncharacterized protein LOC133927604 [Phragmites australis]|uniref:uncharacterized protein LOC133927604 n=1 Tax=Phragmites australis TaxID=29695 RepID=UPI002D7976FA|nr:uncharacterized protein LOC133927604 [Phragmites australis]
MAVQRLKLKAGIEPFHGITPNSSTIPLDQIELLVTFSMLDNFNTEKLNFDVANFKTAYNVILNRPMLGKFMVVVHYTYQTLKILDPKGIINVRGDQRATMRYDKQSLDIVEHLSRVATTFKGVDPNHQKHQATIEIKDSKLFNDAAKGETSSDADNKRVDGGIKAILFDLSEPAKTVKIGANLDPK